MSKHSARCYYWQSHMPCRCGSVDGLLCIQFACLVFQPRSDDDRIVSHDASRLGLYYHCVRDVIIYFTLSGWEHFVLSRLSELRGFAFKGSDLIYIHCVSNENFAVTVKCFTFVSLVCWEVHISYVENICKRRRSLIPAVVANLPMDELFAGIRSPELIRILKFFLSVEDILLVSFYIVSTQMISQEIDWSDHCLGLSN